MKIEGLNFVITFNGNITVDKNNGTEKVSFDNLRVGVKGIGADFTKTNDSDNGTKTNDSDNGTKTKTSDNGTKTKTSDMAIVFLEKLLKTL